MRRTALFAAAAALLALAAAPAFAEKKTLAAIGLALEVPGGWIVNDMSSGDSVMFVTGPKEGAFAVFVEDTSAASFSEAVKSFREIAAKTIDGIESFERQDAPAKLAGLDCAVAAGKAVIEKKPRAFRVLLLDAKKIVLVSVVGEPEKWAASQKEIDAFLAGLTRAG